MKRFIALVFVSAACLQAAPATVSLAGGSEMVMTTAMHGAVMKTEARSFTYALVQPLAVFVDVRSAASTKVVVFGQASQKSAAAQVHWMGFNAHQIPVAKADGFTWTAASSPPTTTLALDTLQAPDHVGITKTPLVAWHPPAVQA